jgi:hypothetical protein
MNNEENKTKIHEEVFKRLDKAIEELKKGQKEFNLIFENCLSNMRKWVDKREGKVLKLIEEFEKTHGKL